MFHAVPQSENEIIYGVMAAYAIYLINVKQGYFLNFKSDSLQLLD